ncbi:MgtC/SapB family protein [Methylobrevis pamukkalensis]|uniref:Protein MgtC n=1 Tax=Methylobrevis pamukkalensis TaxID=1439726 RepID=A0A1E3H3F5_9HYPH|nr:MgtC/SapB family protein [Methylobrevis pamukkalensis]ODN70877.1 putative Mg(2+) transport ATPase [Methylobrevis pamukkalensis]
MRTLGLVALGVALVTLVATHVPGMAENPDALSRVIQGVLQGVMTGIGFIGAGVVLRDPDRGRIKGLTTAASIWMTGALAVTCALASWLLVAVALGLTLFLLIVVRPLDRWLERDRDAR